MNSELYDIFGLGGSSSMQQPALAAVRVDGKVAVIDMREILCGVAPRDRRSLREAVLYLAVSVLRTPLKDKRPEASDDIANPRLG